MTNHAEIAGHYSHGHLVAAITDGFAATGKGVDGLTVEDLAPVDEFHIGGRQASEDFLSQLSLGAGDHVLDVGCGVGGPARLMASRYGSRVTGIDLTGDYIEAGKVLTGWVGLTDQVELHHGSALDMPFVDGTFDAATMMHVGMNIEDKAALVGEVARVLRPGAVFGVYDVMQVGDGDLAFPVPWASGSATSFLAAPERYEALLEAAGFEVTARRNRREFAVAFFEQMRARAQAAGGPPPLGVHIVMGETWKEKIGNLVAGIAAGWIAPVEIVARKS